MRGGMYAAMAEAWNIATQYEKTVAIGRQGLLRAREQEFPLNLHIANALVHLDRIEEAIGPWQRALQLTPDFKVSAWTRNWRRHLMNREDLVERISGGLEKLEQELAGN